MNGVPEFPPTVTGHHRDGDTLVLETIQEGTETNLVSTDEGLVQREELAREFQQDEMTL